MMKNTLLILFFTLNLSLCSGQSKWKLFWKQSPPERCWAITHPFVAMKAWRISVEVRKVSDSLVKAGFMDGDGNGGQLDAFRHSYWMARLCSVMKASKAYKLGKAHEKGNFLQYKKHQNEDGSLPDEAACSMDMWNNCMGIEIAKQYPQITKDSLQLIVTQWILVGKMKIIKKNKAGISLNIENKPITNDTIPQPWQTERILVPSNSARE